MKYWFEHWLFLLIYFHCIDPGSGTQGYKMAIMKEGGVVGQKHIGRWKSTPVIGQNLNTASRETLYQNVWVIVNVLENVILERGQCKYFFYLTSHLKQSWNRVLITFS